MNIIEFKNASLMRNGKYILEDISFSINENTAIIGPNGAGKSTIMRTIYRDLYPIKKENSYIKILGNDTWDLYELRQQIGVISTELDENFKRGINGYDFILSGFFGTIGLYFYHEITQEMKETTNDLAEYFKITNLLDKNTEEMSTGQVKRLQIARALVHNPSTLILDEPTSGLDIGANRRLMKIIQRLLNEKKKIILVTHHIDEILPDIKRVIAVKNGKIFFDGSRDELSGEMLSELFDINIELFEKDGLLYTI